MISLHPDQTEMLDRTVASMRAGNRNVLLQMPTGSGKTVVASEIVRRATAKGSKTWFLVPRKELLRQTSATYRQFGLRHTYIASGYHYNPYAYTAICSTETVKRRLDGLATPNLAIIDELHYGGAGLDTIIKWLKERGAFIVGLTATPWRLSGQGLGCWMDDMVDGPSIKWLIDNRRLSGYRAYAPSAPDLSGVGKTAGDYSKGQLDERMRADRVLIGNAVSHYKQHAMGRLCVAYCVSVAHAEQVAEAFREQGVPAAAMDGTTPDEVRKHLIGQFADRKLMVLTNCDLLTFGFDLAAQVGRDVTVEVMSDLRPTKSLALQMQKWGRVLRRKDDPAQIFDHAGNIAEHGMPCEDRPWSLSDWKTKGERGGVERSLPVRQCSNCFFCHKPSPSCPSCGYVYPVDSRKIDEIDGMLAEIKEAQARKSKSMEVGMARTIDDLRRIAKERGYKSGWIYKQAQIKGIRV